MRRAACESFSSFSRIGLRCKTGRDHIRCHSITYEKNNIFCLPYLAEVSYKPASIGLGTVVVGQGGSVFWESLASR